MSDSFDISQPKADLTDVAADWLAALDAGSADMVAFEAWRDADIRHAIAFAEVARTWRDLNNLRLVQGHLQSPAGEEPAPEQPSRRHVIRAAASLAAVIVAGGGLAYRAYARDTASTLPGERRAVSVNDRLAIDLNTDSRIHWRAGEPTRLWLERGEVAIRLAPTQKVELLTPGGVFQLMPGIYNARLRNESCELAVLHGGISADGAKLEKGEIGLATAGRIAARPGGNMDLNRITAWQRDTLVLNGESLDYALSEINRYLPNKIVIGDPALSRIRMGGTFATTNTDEFLKALHSSFGIRATPSANGGIILTRA